MNDPERPASANNAFLADVTLDVPQLHGRWTIPSKRHTPSTTDDVYAAATCSTPTTAAAQAKVKNTDKFNADVLRWVHATP